MSASDKDRLLSLFSWISALLLTIGLATIMGFLIIRGCRSLTLHLIFSDTPPLDALLLNRPVFGGLFPISSEYAGPAELMTGFGAAIILLLICSGMFVLAHALRYWIDHQARLGG